MCWHHVAEGYFGDILETIPASILRVSEWLLPHWDGMLGEYVLQGNLSSEVNQFVLVGYFYPRCLLCVCWHPGDSEESSKNQQHSLLIHITKTLKLDEYLRAVVLENTVV